MEPQADTDRSRSPRQRTDVGEVVEITELGALCSSLEAPFERALVKAGADPSRVVLVLDLDETCFTPLAANGLATSAWFEDILQRWASKLNEAEGMSTTQTLMQILAVVDAFYPRAPVGLTDTALPAMLQRCKAWQVGSVGLTSRRPELAPATWRQMEGRCKLEFDSLEPALDPEAILSLEKSLRTSEQPDCWEGISSERGVWFTANANKGSVLRKVLEPGMHVIFVDDSLRHLKAVATSLDGHAASVSLFHFTAAVTAAKRRLDRASCDHALAEHCAALFAENDALFMTLVQERQAFLSRFIAGQIDVKEQQDQKIDDSWRALAQALGKL